MIRGRHYPTLVRLVLATLCFAALPVAVFGITPCLRSANQMARSCRAEALEERFAGLAICNLVADAGERSACNDEVEDAFQEAMSATCNDIHGARQEVCELLDEQRHVDPLTDEGNEFVDLDEIGESVAANPYFSLVVGHTYVLRAGEEGEETVVVTVTDETKEFNGQACRVVVDVVLIAGNGDEEDGEEGDEAGFGAGAWIEKEGEIEYAPVEVTDDFYTQTVMGDVVYCGEDTVEIAEQGLRDGTSGSFYSGNEDGAHAGLLISANPVVGVAHRQELSLGEAEDVIEYVSLDAVPTADQGGDNDAFPCAPGGCLQSLDSSPLHPGVTELKFYKAGVGFVLAVPMEDGEPTGEREELVCLGDSIDILQDEACGIEDPGSLLETLCEVAPHAFCGDEG